MDNSKPDIFEDISSQSPNGILFTRDESDDPDLYDAVKTGNMERVKHLIVNGANVETKTRFGLNLLFVAAEYGQVACLKYLIENTKLDPRERSEGNTILHMCSLRGHFDCLEYLIETQKLDDLIHEENEKGDTPLMTACIPVQSLFNPPRRPQKHNYLKCVWYLLELLKELSASESEFKSRINKKNKKGETALHHACYSGNEPRVRYLIDNGASLEGIDLDKCHHLGFRDWDLRPLLKSYMEA